MSVSSAAKKQQFRAVGSTAMMKVAVMGISGFIGILTTRMIISNFGTEAYAQYGLLVSLGSLLPFADLGVGTAVITAVAASRNPAEDDVVRRTVLTAFRIVLLSTVVISLGAVTLTALGLWRPLLGDAMTADGEWPAMVVMIVFAIGVPFGIGQCILVGLGRTTRQIANQFVVSPTMFLLVTLSVALAVPAGSWLAVYSYAANGLAGALCLWQAARLVRPQLRRVARQLLRPHEYPGLKVMDVAWPMLVQLVVLPFAMGSDRLMLSHLSGSPELVEYNLAAQLFGIILQTIAAAGVALWPVFAKNRATSTVQSPWQLCLLFGLGGLILAAGLCLVSPWVVAFVSDGKINLHPPLLLAFSAYVIVQAAKYPLGMYMTDVRGLRFQIGPIIAMVPLKIGLSLLLIPVLGAAGTVWSTALAVGLCQVLANVWWIRRDLDRRRAAVDEAQRVATAAHNSPSDNPAPMKGRDRTP
ncbi:lipopolysaccharide biosynthesis protein [Kocuria sp. CH-021]|uniref:lipopolysaccharide biosynthesis protein n=1 Tax=Kocuria sp. CH-021 TaxID=3406735 RepID=UPI003C713D29